LRRIVLLLIFLAAGTARAQQAPAAQTPPPVDSPKETDKLKESCFNLKGIPDCAEELFTGTPIHIAVGSIAPQDGFGAGLAYVGHKTTDNWRISWNADAVGSNNASWRAGFYMKFVHTPNQPVGVGFGTPPPPKFNRTELPEHTVFGFHAQTISLNKITYFGLGPATTGAGRSYYGMTETIVGGNVVRTIYQRLNMSLFGEINGRFVNIRPSTGQQSPSIEQIYTEATAPGLTNQPSVLQLGEGIRMRPVRVNDVVRLNYSLAYQQYFAPGDSTFSFQRLTVDLGNEFALYGKTTRLIGPIPGNGPDSCFLNPADKKPKCPNPYVRNAEGTIGVRFFTSLSMTPGGDIVPFYFQPTLGGLDINGNSSLSSYQDYRFRAPNVMFFRESFEHSIFRLPLGIAFQADEGKIAMTRGGLGSSPWIHSFSAGLTLRAGGFPQVFLFYSWGGNEGTHLIANVNSSLLGGATRPSLF
jgi:hypothetical protein